MSVLPVWRPAPSLPCPLLCQLHRLSVSLEYLCLAGKPHAGEGAKAGSTGELVPRVGALLRVGAPQSLCSGWEHRRAYVQSFVGFPLVFFIPLFPAQADLDR